MTAESSTPVSATALPDFNKLMAALAVPARWCLLKLMTNGERWMASELAPLAGCSPAMACKHMRVLRDAGLVATSTRGSTTSRSICCRRPARRWWIAASACCGWMRSENRRPEAVRIYLIQQSIQLP